MPKAEDKDNTAFEKLIEELKRNCRRNWFRPDKVWVYADPKCPYCNSKRMIHATAPNGQELVDDCKCGERKKQVWTANPYEVEAFLIPDNPQRAAELVPSKVDVHGAIVMSWWVDPSPEGETHPDLMLYNSLFSSMEKFEEYCRKTGVPVKTEEMEEEEY